MSINKVTTNYMNDGFIIKNNGENEVNHIPYNLNNILVNESDIIEILAQYNVNIDKINHLEYFRQAFTHKSYCKKDIYPQNILEDAKLEFDKQHPLLELMDESYERIEYFGDRVLKLIVSMYLFHRYPKQDEGFMTRLQTKLEDKKNLAIMSKEIGLNKFFIISRQIEMMNGRNLEKIHEDVFESFVGALFLSNGFEPCMFLIVNLLETLIDYSEKLYCDNNYKDQLLRVHHQRKWKFPQYITIHFEGPPHKRKYIMGVENCDITQDCPINKRCISFGVGSSKKEGEQNAAKMALIKLGILNQDQYSQSDIFYPPWDKINNFDGETMIINPEQYQCNDLISIVEDKPVKDKPVEDKPVEDKSVKDKPVEDKPVEDKSVKDKPVKDKPVEDKPVEDKPVEDKSVKDKPVKDKPVKDKPVKDKPVKDKPVKDKPVKDKPVKDKPVKDKPVKKSKKVCNTKKKTDVIYYDSDFSDKSI
jgi:dsRNA-specific ribonuclease